MSDLLYITIYLVKFVLVSVAACFIFYGGRCAGAAFTEQMREEGRQDGFKDAIAKVSGKAQIYGNRYVIFNTDVVDIWNEHIKEIERGL